jgi:CRISPR-associated protein Csd2
MSGQTNRAETILRSTGLLLIEVINSNPNGDPDRESDPRQRPDDRGEISPVSFKRKIRDLIENKDGPVWQKIAASFDPPLAPERFHILESRGRDRQAIISEIGGDGEVFKQKYWDGRVFGNTFLEEGGSTSIKTGVVQFGMGISIAPILIERITNTNKAGVQEGKDRGMAPLGYRIVQHGVYCMPFFVNPTAATRTGCTKEDLEIMLETIPYAYAHTASYVRPFVEIRHAWHVEHKSALGSCSDFAIIEALSPKRKKEYDSERPSSGWHEYDVPAGLPDDLMTRVNSCVDLMSEC